MRELSTEEIENVSGGITFGFPYPGTGGSTYVGVSIGFGNFGIGFASGGTVTGVGVSVGFDGAEFAHYAR